MYKLANMRYKNAKCKSYYYFNIIVLKAFQRGVCEHELPGICLLSTTETWKQKFFVSSSYLILLPILICFEINYWDVEIYDIEMLTPWHHVQCLIGYTPLIVIMCAYFFDIYFFVDKSRSDEYRTDFKIWWVSKLSDSY